MPRRKNLRVVEMGKAFAFEPVNYNDSLLRIEHDSAYPPDGELGTYIGYWPTSKGSIKSIQDNHLKNIRKALA